MRWYISIWINWNCLTDSETVEKGGRWVLACLVSATIEFKLIFKKCSMIRKYRNWFCVSVMAVGRSLVPSLSLVSACYETIDFLHMILLCRFFFVIVVVIIIIMSWTNWLDFLFVVFSLLRWRRRSRRKIIETAFTDWDASLSLNLLSRSFHSIPFHFVCICLNTLNFIFFFTFCKFSTQKSTIIPSNLSESMNLI